MKTIKVLIVFFLAFFLFSCSNNDAEENSEVNNHQNLLIGNWKLKDVDIKLDQDISKGQRSMMEQMIDKMILNTTLMVSSDSTYNYKTSMLGMNRNENGKWYVQNGVLTTTNEEGKITKMSINGLEKDSLRLKIKESKQEINLTFYKVE